MGKRETVTDFILRAPKSLQMVTTVMKLKDACLFEEKPIHFFKWRHNFAENVQYNQSYDFSSCHVWI